MTIHPQIATWRGSSGTDYDYVVHASDTDWGWAGFPGVYIFARNDGDYWTALYVGQTGDLSSRLGAHHEKFVPATYQGMTHIHVHLNPDEPLRMYEEADMRLAHDPPLNDEPL